MSGLTIYVRTLEGKIHRIEMSKDSTILDLKTKVYDKEGIEPGMQEIMYKGNKCEDEKTMTDYNVEEGDGFHLVQRNR